MRWPIALTIGFAILILWNATFVYLAVSYDDPVVPSYNAGER